ncbi:hypothetical protein GCM10022223_53470 [Kineosporia mesophila]|uniref:Bacterial CdiA-CT RNAse A domain-containing protein n=1 Tax=Kineosporia mesophila TaxID=566012 RepID=A0ABP7ACU4_9ACTN|nr:hypothetical protein [Kineosporia mesophila]MCD5351271.1 hypothetical protein [Kineosporia mesophila]
MTALATALRQRHDQVVGAATTAGERALNCWEHGWDSVAQGYETASEHLTEIVGELAKVCERAERCAHILQPLHDEHGLTGVADRLDAATAEIGTGLDGVLCQLDEARMTMAATGEEYLTGALHDVIEKIEESGEALSTIQMEIAEEQVSARRGGIFGDAPEGDSPGALAATRTRIVELRRQGHAPQRHGAQITDQQLTDRALWGKDPITGTTTDGATGGIHNYNRNATKFTTDTALVDADTYLRSSEEFKTQERNAAVTLDPRVQVNVPLQQVFGANYHHHIHGIQRTGSKNKPTGDPPGSQQPITIDFTDGTLFALYRKNAAGEYQLITMFPRPKD